MQNASDDLSEAALQVIGWEVLNFIFIGDDS